MSKAIVRIFSHHFTVKVQGSPAMRAVVGKFASYFDEYKSQEEGGYWVRRFSNSYSAPTADADIDWDHKDLEYRFHINALANFKKILEKAGVRPEDVEYIVEPVYEAKTVQIKIRPEFKPFEDQVSILDQLKQETPVSKLLPLQTGGGKSALSLFAAAFWNLRTVAFMKPGYIPKWVGDIKKQCIVEDDDIVAIGGEKKDKGGLDRLAWLINGLMDGWLNPTFILISNATFRAWIAQHEKLPPGELVPGFRIAPWEFMQACSIGFRIIDETHQDWHFNFKLDLYTHVEQSLSLSATLISRDEFLMMTYRVGYPEANRMIVPEYRKFVKSIAWIYDIADHRRLRCTGRGRSTYSHVAFEKSLMSQQKLLKQYMLMIYDALRKTYFFERKIGEKCIIYFATKKMCELAIFYYRQLMPEIKFEKYNQGDDLNKALKADIIIATLQKAGTAIDIPNLTTVMMTVAVDSIQAVLQCIGRLRDLKRLYGSDRIPAFMYFVCANIDKQVRYHRSKQELLQERALYMTQMQHTATLGF